VTAPTLIARARAHPLAANVAAYLAQTGVDEAEAADLAARLGDGIEVAPGAADVGLAALASAGFLDFHAPGDGGAATLTPCRFGFALGDALSADTLWQVSRLAYLHYEDGRLIARSPLGDCFLILDAADAQALLHGFGRPAAAPAGDARAAAIVWMLARAAVIVPCEADGRPAEAKDPKLRQWDFHELLFHSRSRLGRTEGPYGGTFAFKDEIAPLPAIKPNPWIERLQRLPWPDLAVLARADITLTQAIETRRSVRQHSPVPPSIAQIGEFLFRTVRDRGLTEAPEYGGFVSRPYPNGGACYEQEFYLAIEASADFPRGFYYYDPYHHGLCLISPPDAEMQALVDGAAMATGGQGRPQVLITIASRFHRIGWKYRAMGYATQLKNVGAIYQTMYLVATAMGLAPSALGAGDTDRFCRMAGVDYLEEGSIGEFMLGRAM
jgi:SagB-type dehydrogenase family enzyme